MFISIPKEFFVPVTYEYKNKLNIEDNEMTRESKGKIETGVQYVKQLVTEEMADVAKGNMYVDIDDEYVKEATEEINKGMEGVKPSGETYNSEYKNYCNKECNRNFYEDIDYEYVEKTKKQ